MQIVHPGTLIFQATLALILGGGVAFIGAQVAPAGAWFGLVPLLLVAWYGLRRPLRRWRAAQHPLPPAARAWLAAHVPLYRRLDRNGQARFERDMRFILEEWIYEGVDGVTVTDVLRWGVAAGAAMLLHGRPDWELPPHHTVLFYPGSFGDDYMPADDAAFDGMAHPQGPVIVSTLAFEESWADPTDGSNVVLHELAHLLDYENAFADGVPALVDAASAGAWRQLVRREMRKVQLGRSMLRRYAATNPAEFFAVAVENFFERPDVMRERHPALYEAMAAFFNLDPAALLT